jgi:hypothetical protein
MKIIASFLVVLLFLATPTAIVAWQGCQQCADGCGMTMAREIYDSPYPWCDCPTGMDCIPTSACETCNGYIQTFCDGNYYYCSTVYYGTFNVDCGCGGGIPV